MFNQSKDHCQKKIKKVWILIPPVVATKGNFRVVFLIKHLTRNFVLPTDWVTSILLYLIKPFCIPKIVYFFKIILIAYKTIDFY